MTDASEDGFLDTSVVIDLGVISREKLPKRIAISAVTLAELAAGPAASKDPDVRVRRQEQLQRAESTFNPLPLYTRNPGDFVGLESLIDVRAI